MNVVQTLFVARWRAYSGRRDKPLARRHSADTSCRSAESPGAEAQGRQAAGTRPTQIITLPFNSPLHRPLTPCKVN